MVETVNDFQMPSLNTKTIYIKTNGVHLDIILPKQDIAPRLLTDINHKAEEQFLAFGWGDENFYLNTPTWGDLTFSNAFGAMFLKSSTLMHVTRYTSTQSNWIEIKVSEDQLKALNAYIYHTFQVNNFGQKLWLQGQGYTSTDDFYKARGSYSCLTTCNTWVNSGFKVSGLKAREWTPFDFGLTNIYSND